MERKQWNARCRSARLLHSRAHPLSAAAAGQRPTCRKGSRRCAPPGAAWHSPSGRACATPAGGGGSGSRRVMQAGCSAALACARSACCTRHPTPLPPPPVPGAPAAAPGWRRPARRSRPASACRPPPPPASPQSTSPAAARQAQRSSRQVGGVGDRHRMQLARCCLAGRPSPLSLHLPPTSPQPPSCSSPDCSHWGASRCGRQSQSPGGTGP